MAIGRPPTYNADGGDQSKAHPTILAMHHLKLIIAVAAAAIAQTVALPQASATILRGQRQAVLRVYQVESGSVNRSWAVDTPITVVVDTDFNNLRLVGLFVNCQESVYEDMAQNFEFAFHYVAQISGPTADLDSLPSSNWWTTGIVAESASVAIELDRIIFGDAQHFSVAEQPTVPPGISSVNFTGYPTNTLYSRSTVSWTDLGRVDYATNHHLSFVLEWPGEVSLAALSPDLDSDGDVDGNDFLLWQRGSTQATGLTAWRSTFGTGSLAPMPVPEPIALEMTIMSASLLLCVIGMRHFDYRSSRTSSAL